MNASFFFSSLKKYGVELLLAVSFLLFAMVGNSFAVGEKTASPPLAPSSAVPSLPPGDISPSEAVKLRDELELLRRDVIQKIQQLEQAKAGYDITRNEIEEKLKKQEEDRRLLDETLQKEKNLKEERVNAAVTLIAKMDPRKAAPVLEGMDRDLVIALMTHLPQRQVTSILENMVPAKATQFLEYYTRIRSGREFEMLRELGLCSSPDRTGNG